MEERLTGACMKQTPVQSCRLLGYLLNIEASVWRWRARRRPFF